MCGSILATQERARAGADANRESVRSADAASGFPTQPLRLVGWTSQFRHSYCWLLGAWVSPIEGQRRRHVAPEEWVGFPWENLWADAAGAVEVENSSLKTHAPADANQRREISSGPLPSETAALWFAKH